MNHHAQEEACRLLAIDKMATSTVTRTKSKSAKRASVPEPDESPAKVAKVDAKDIRGKDKKPTVGDIFESLEYGPAPESPAVAQAWLDDHGRRFGHFIGNQWVSPEGRQMYKSYDPSTGDLLAETVQGKTAKCLKPCTVVCGQYGYKCMFDDRGRSSSATELMKTFAVEAFYY